MFEAVRIFIWYVYAVLVDLVEFRFIWAYFLLRQYIMSKISDQSRIMNEFHLLISYVLHRPFNEFVKWSVMRRVRGQMPVPPFVRRGL